MRQFIVLFSLLLFALLQSGCSDENTILASSECECEAGDTITVELGTTYTVSLLAAYTAGFKWEIQKGFDERYVELEFYSIVPLDPDSNMDGAAMFQEWTYLTRGLGTVCGTLIYFHRSDKIPISTKNVVVIIE